MFLEHKNRGKKNNLFWSWRIDPMEFISVQYNFNEIVTQNVLYQSVEQSNKGLKKTVNLNL